jgi:2-phosphosulfolactate phosphatase
LQLQIFFTPSNVTAVPVATGDVYIVIDVIRATTTLAVIFDQGASRVLIANTLDQAQRARLNAPDRLLCGERNTLPLPGFDYGNSPAQFAQVDLHKRELILTTTNGTRAFFACPGESIRLAGCFYNAQAVTAQALSVAQERGSNISIVCAGEENYFALDDTACAGYLALELLRQQPELQVHESVHAATALYQAYMPPRLIDYCESAQKVLHAGLQSDLDFCMRTNVSTSVPMIVGRDRETGLLILERI